MAEPDFTPAGPESGIVFPVTISCESASVALAPGITLTKMDEAAKATFLRIESAEYNEQGRLTKYQPLPVCPLNMSMVFYFGTRADHPFEFCASNYLLYASSSQAAQDINAAIKLSGLSRTALYVGFGPGKAIQFINPPCYYGQDALVVSPHIVDTVAANYASILKMQGDARGTLLLEKYLLAVSSYEISQESRFVEAAIALEMLLLPGSQTELSYRYSLRMAKLLSSRFGMAADAAYAQAKQVYDIRSRLVHSGADKRVKDVLHSTLDLARQFVCLYLAQPEIFSTEALDALCLS